MIPATEQQLQLVSRKVVRLETSVQAQIELVKSLREDRQKANERVEILRSELANAEEVATKFNFAHDEAQESLRQTAAEYARTQLLQKRFQNTLLELQGYNRSIARVINTNRGSQQFVLADECTVNATERKKSFVLDSVFDDASNDDFLESAAGIPQFVADCLAGYNCTYFTFGPARAGKTELMYGTQALDIMRIPHASGQQQQGFDAPAAPSNGSAAAGPSTSRGRSASAGGPAPSAGSIPGASKQYGTNGVLPRFVRYLFSHMESHDVTHYNIRCSFIELHQDQVVDLLSDYGSSVMSLGSAANGGAGLASLNEVSAVQVQTIQDVLYLFQNGLQRTGLQGLAGGGAYRSVSGGSSSAAGAGGSRPPSHTAFTLLIENFNTRGHFRRSHVAFVDLCGSQSPTISTPEQQWINKSISAVCDVISMLSATKDQQQNNPTGQQLPSASSSNGFFPTNQQQQQQHSRVDIPHRHNRLVQLLRDALGGNSKAVMLCCADAQHSTVDEVITALTYGYFFKSIQQHAVPYDIPPELQRLNLQMGGLPMDD